MDATPGRARCPPSSRRRARNGCSRAPATRRIARGIIRTRWRGCDLERILNSTIGHEWPRLGPYDTSKEVWRFISAYTTG